MNRQRRLALLGGIQSAGAAALGLRSIPGLAQDRYPSRPITIVVPYAAGGTTDTITRLVGKHMSAKLGQPIVIDNRPGANGAIGSHLVVKAAPNGYSLLSVSASTMTRTFIKNLPFDIMRDLATVSLLSQGSYVLMANGGLPVRSMTELIAHARANPGKLSVAVPSSTATIAVELLRRAADIDVVAVPYKGSAPAMNALLGGEIQLAIDVPIGYVNFFASGKLRPIAVTGDRRIELIGDVPTVGESGLRYVVRYAGGLWAPAGTPAAIVSVLSQAAMEATANPEVRETLRQSGIDAIGSTPEAMRSRMQEEIDFNTRGAELINFVPQ